MNKEKLLQELKDKYIEPPDKNRPLSKIRTKLARHPSYIEPIESIELAEGFILNVSEYLLDPEVGYLDSGAVQFRWGHNYSKRKMRITFSRDRITYTFNDENMAMASIPGIVPTNPDTFIEKATKFLEKLLINITEESIIDKRNNV